MSTTITDLAKYNVTESQLDRCHRVIDLNTVSASVFYQVESQTTEGETYEVRYLQGKGLTCTCKAGREGVPCWHKRAVVLHSRLYQAQLAQRTAQSEAAEQAEYTAHIARLVELGLTTEQATAALASGSDQDDATLARVYGAKPKASKPAPKGNLYSNHGFSLMR